LEIRSSFSLEFLLLAALQAVNFLSLNKLESCEALNQEDDGEDKLSFSAWDSLTIGEQSASSVLYIVNELIEWIEGFSLRSDTEIELTLVD
jgi:hypothetical protein